ncbi:NUDIX domain-containing protein [Streptomyces sp. SID2999]|uniref:NUDIX domain-containing protein n=1 Tax=Streptomyces sp. SID2999 TaxID=2690258 RepID=UPI00136A1DEE|nr:NUDIX domain-containing protein [Streptomyces sp. SID2999]MYZ11536.1 NUDIX domain-containing protein [Streptomyces sp. SID2999]
MTAELWDVSRLRFEETAPPALTADLRTAMDHRWAAAVRANPNLFDGPVAALAGFERDDAGGLSVSWTRLTYRYRALRGLPDAPAVAALFVAVLQPSDDGRLLVGRMSPTTSAPGRWQPPGGTLEPPCDGAALDLGLARAHAARELAEETGSDTPADALVAGPVVLGARGSLGFLFTAPPRPARELRERHAELARTETASGVAPEFDRVELIGSPAELRALPGPSASYLELAAGRFFGA